MFTAGTKVILTRSTAANIALILSRYC